MSRECKKCGGIILEDDLGCQGCAADRRIAEARRELNDRLLHMKQQERREFVKCYVLAIINGYHANGCRGGSEDVNFLHITEDGARRFDILDKQLAELEQSESKEQVK